MDFNNMFFVISFLSVVFLNEWFCSTYTLSEEVSHIRSSKDKPQEYRARIIGGTLVSSIKDYPYNAYIFIRKNDGSSKGFSCGGSIIGIKWILTAGHCLPSGIPLQNMILFVGSKQRNNGKRLEVKHATKHPKYQMNLVQSTGKPDYLYDYMILELSQNLVYSSKVERIVIGSVQDIATGEEAILTGYGLTSKALEEGAPLNTMLHMSVFTMSSYLDCHRVVPYLAIFEFCARKQGTSSFMGDSGSPLVAKTKNGFRLIGVMSHGVNATDGLHSDVYCSVPFVETWINDIIGA